MSTEGTVRGLIVAMAIVAIAGLITSCVAGQRDAIVQMVGHGADPLAAACAVGTVSQVEALTICSRIAEKTK